MTRRLLVVSAVAVAMVAVASAARAQVPGPTAGREPRPASAQPLGTAGASRGEVGDAQDAVGRSRPAGQLHQQVRDEHAVRAAEGVRRPPHRRRHARRSWRQPCAKRQQDTLARAKFFGGDPEGRSATRPSSATSTRSTRGSRPWFVVDPQDGKIPPMRPRGARRASPRCRAPAAASATGRSTAPRTSACGTAASRAACPARCCRGSTATPIRSCRGPASSPSATRWCTTRASFRSISRPHVGSAIRSTWAMRAAAGKATRWSSRRRTSRRAASTGTPTPTRCGWSSASRAPRPTRSSGR